MQTLSLLRVTLCACAVLALSGVSARGNIYLAKSASASPAAKPGFTLSSDQQARVLALQQKLRQNVAVLDADKTQSPDAKQATLQKLLQGYDADLLTILTPAQRAIVDKKRAVIQANIVQIQQMAATLQKSLTEKQNKQMDDIMASTLKQVQKIKDDTKLTDSAKASQIAGLRQDAEERTKAALTAGQLVTYIKMRKLQHTVEIEDRELTAH